MQASQLSHSTKFSATITHTRLRPKNYLKEYRNIELFDQVTVSEIRRISVCKCKIIFFVTSDKKYNFSGLVVKACPSPIEAKSCRTSLRSISDFVSSHDVSCAGRIIMKRKIKQKRLQVVSAITFRCRLGAVTRNVKF